MMAGRRADPYFTARKKAITPTHTETPLRTPNAMPHGFSAIFDRLNGKIIQTSIIASIVSTNTSNINPETPISFTLNFRKNIVTPKASPAIVEKMMPIVQVLYLLPYLKDRIYITSPCLLYFPYV